MSDFCYHNATQLYPRSYTLSYAVKFQWQLGKFGRDLKLNYYFHFSRFLCPLSAGSLAMLVMILIWQYRICLAIWNIASQSIKPAQWMVDCKWKEDVFITTYHFLSSLHKYFIMTSCDISYSYEPHIPIGWIGVHFDCFHSNVLPFFVSLLIWLAKDFAVLLNLIRF